MGAGGGARPARGYAGALQAPLSGSVAPPQKLCKLCIINVLNHKEFHCSSPPKNHAHELRLAHLKCFKHMHIHMHKMTKLAKAVFITSKQTPLHNIYDQLYFSHHFCSKRARFTLRSKRTFWKGKRLRTPNVGIHVHYHCKLTLHS